MNYIEHKQEILNQCKENLLFRTEAQKMVQTLFELANSNYSNAKAAYDQNETLEKTAEKNHVFAEEALRSAESSKVYTQDSIAKAGDVALRALNVLSETFAMAEAVIEAAKSSGELFHLVGHIAKTESLLSGLISDDVSAIMAVADDAVSASILALESAFDGYTAALATEESLEAAMGEYAYLEHECKQAIAQLNAIKEHMQAQVEAAEQRRTETKVEYELRQKELDKANDELDDAKAMYAAAQSAVTEPKDKIATPLLVSAPTSAQRENLTLAEELN